MVVAAMLCAGCEGLRNNKLNDAYACMLEYAELSNYIGYF